MKPKDDTKQDQKKGQQEVQTLTNSYLMIDPNKSNGVLQGLYNYTDYNAFSRPTEDIDVSTGSVTQSPMAMPNPIVGKYIHLPDGTVTLPALAWASDTASGLYKIGANNFGESVSGTRVFDWNATRIFYATDYRMRFYTDAVAGISSGTEIISARKDVDDPVFVLAARNATAGSGGTSNPAMAMGVLNDAGNCMVMHINGTGHGSFGRISNVAGAGCLILNDNLGTGLHTTSPMIIANENNGYMAFGTNNTERIRILAGGTTIVGTTTQSASGELFRVFGITRSDGVLYVNTLTPHTGTVITTTNQFYIGSGSVGDTNMPVRVNAAADTIFPSNPSTLEMFTTNAQAAGMGAGILLGGVYTGSAIADFAYIAGQKENGTNANYSGKLVLGVRLDGAGTADMTRMVISSTGTINHYNTSVAVVNTLSAAASTATVFNEQGADIDFRIEGDTATSLFFVDASVDRIISTVSDTSTTPIYDFIQNSTGDSAIRFAIGTTTSFAVGVDNSDSDKFKISYAGSGSAALGTNDYFIILTNGSVGVNTSSPTRYFEVTDNAAAQIRLNHTASSVYTDLQTDSSGNFIITPTGPDIDYVKSYTSAAIRMVFFNTDNTTATAGATMLVATGGASGGDPMVHWLVSGVNQFVMGMDNSDSDKLKISGSGALGTSDYFVIETGGTIWFGSHSAIGAETVTGYITIKDIAGNSRKLAVVS